MSGADWRVIQRGSLPESGAPIQVRVGESDPYPDVWYGEELQRYVALYGNAEHIFWRPSDTVAKR